jgi:RHS repeat-associated protein
MTNMSKGYAECDDYFPFGETVFCTGNINVDKFTGKELDSESNLNNYGARYLASQMGRFVSPDPTGGHLDNPQSLNRYAYVGNNPLNFIDPTGLDCVYLNDAGTGVESVDPERDTDIGECQSNGGFYATGTLSARMVRSE